MSEPLTAAGRDLLRSWTEPNAEQLAERSAWTRDWLALRIPAIEAEAAARAVDEALSVLGEHEGNGCCDPKTLEHIAQSIRGRS